MKNKIVLGTNGERDIWIDLEVLLKTRLLIQANSGGGKSFLIRRLAEQMFGKIPVIIIDPEGEFNTLREKFGYVLVGQGGETPADLRSAAMVAHKILELRASAVCDLYELKPQMRHQWVRLFLDALIDAPKNLWRPTIIVLDEAHQFSPEVKSGESEASGAVVDLCTRGRKRGYCAILATQRLGKLRKDAAAELLNVMVGMTFIDIDRERACECLGIGREEKHSFNDEVKLLEPGQFYCLGRAICKERTLIKVGNIKTTHPEAGGGKFSMAPPPAPEVVKAMMPKLADLPKAAEEKAKTESELRGEIRSLKAQLSSAVKSQNQIQPADKNLAVSIKKELAQTLNALKEAMKFIVEITTRNFGEDIPKDKIQEAIVAATKTAMAQVEQKFEARKKEMGQLKTTAERVLDRIKRLTSEPIQVSLDVKHNEPFTVSQPVASRPVATSETTANGEFKLGRCERAILTALAQYPQGRSAVQVALLSEYSVNSGGFNNSLGKLRSVGFITRSNPIQITEEGIKQVGEYEPLPTGEELARHWISKLGRCEAAILSTLVENYPNALTPHQIGEATNYSPQSGGFNNALGRLRTLELITRGQPIKATDEFFQ